MKGIVLFCYLFLMPSILSAQENFISNVNPYDMALVIYDKNLKTKIDENPSFSGRQLAPCSTFKIYNTLIGLELGLIKGVDELWYKWDGVERFIDGWNQDLTLREAFRVSAVPAYQMLAREIGAVRMKEYIDKIGYGTENISAGVDIFWLPRPDTTSIMISADEQIVLLNRFLDGELPFSEKNIEILRDIMLVEKTEKGALYGKTGSGMDSDNNWNLGWFIGFLESNGKTYVFSCNITGGESPSGLIARKIVQEYFRNQGLL